MATVIDELVTILGFDVDSGAAETLAGFTGGIKSISNYANIASAALVTASASVLYFASQANDATDKIGKLGTVTGISTDTIQEMSFAMEQVGGDASTMLSDLEGLMMSMNSPIPGEFNEGLMLLGISTKKASGELKTADEVMLDLADKMEGMSKQEQLHWGKKVGISKDTIMLLQEGRGEVERLRKQAQDLPTVISKESIANARMFNQQMSLIGSVMSALGQEISASLGPAVKDIVGGMVEWIGQNKEFIKMSLDAVIGGVVSGFTRFGQTIGKIIAYFSELFPGVSSFVKVMVEADVISSLVYASLTALAVSLGIAVAPFLALTAAIAAAGLIFEDFMTYLEGGDSIIGAVIDKILSLVDIFRSIPDAIGSGWDAVTGFFGGDSSSKNNNDGGGGGFFSKNNPTYSYSSQKSQVSSNTTNDVKITVTGDNASAVAAEVSAKLKTTLQQTYPGGLAPAVQ